MKKTITFLALFASLTIFAQAPQKMSYQSVLRNSSDVLLANTAVGMRISILQGSAAGTAVYVETQTPSTNSNGLVSLEIGGGSPVTGTFSSINWGANTYFIKTETDPTGGTNYTITGTSQLLSVPYALYAQNSGNNLQQVVTAGNIATRTLTHSSPNGILLNNTYNSNVMTSYYGLRSNLSSTSGYSHGLLGLSNGVNPDYNIGVRGWGANADLENIGLIGTAIGSGNANNYGVWGVASNAINANNNRGVFGEALATTETGGNVGVEGNATGSSWQNAGIVGSSYGDISENGWNFGAIGVAYAPSAIGTVYGVFGSGSGGSVNYAGFFDGNVTVTGTFVQPSDRKLKKDIHSVTSALDKIQALQPVSYYYDETKSSLNLSKNLQYGFIAQDLEAVFPNLVTNQIKYNPDFSKSKRKLKFDANGEIINDKESEESQKQANESKKEEFKGINYTGLISILTQGIKEQQEQIEALKAKNEALEKRMQNIEKLLLKK
jgi:hypothetical protein